MSKLLGSSILFCALLPACSQTNDVFEAKAIREEINKINPGRCSAPKLGNVYIGDSVKEAEYCGWGTPTIINATTQASGSKSQWVYRGKIEGYLYFNNDILYTVQRTTEN